eukprot:CAMPEP_0185285886 /NCGR_PEP_ID=MMETSP1363-20130426/1971_1 /TAXON_ID=38817 /ORGANISM="Gephyrocapsa oceanica, Strain RCC1303" /LENGTH=40 /DNA_ID= /DNA_START= /DNA_END= /DNA_ORIENTATION=
MSGVGARVTTRWPPQANASTCPSALARLPDTDLTLAEDRR